MPDDRLFHKTLGHSEKVNALTDFEDLVWRSYVLTADDFGVMRFSAITLQASTDRLARKSQKIVQRALEAVRAVDLIRTFDHQGRIYCYQWDWQDWQKITYPKRTVNPTIPADALTTCSDHTRWLFRAFPGGKKIDSWKCPDSFLKDSGKSQEKIPIHSSSARMTNGYDYDKRLTASEPFDSFEPELPAASAERRSGDFVERYKALHVRLRKGAHYLGNPLRDFQESLQLVAVYDDARLDKLAFVWLNTDHDFAQNGTRSIAKFRSMASWCEERLIEFEEKHGELKVAVA